MNYEEVKAIYERKTEDTKEGSLWSEVVCLLM